MNDVAIFLVGDELRPKQRLQAQLDGVVLRANVLDLPDHHLVNRHNGGWNGQNTKYLINGHSLSSR